MGDGGFDECDVKMSLCRYSWMASQCDETRGFALSGESERVRAGCVMMSAMLQQQPAAASAIHCNKSGDVVEQGREISGSISGRNKKEMFRWDRVIAARQLSWMGDIEWASLA